MVMTAMMCYDSAGGTVIRKLSPETDSIDTLIKAVTLTSSGLASRDLKGHELVYAFKYAKYPFGTFARPSKVKAMAVQKNRRNLTMTHIIKHKLSKRIKVRLTLRDDGRAYARIDHELHEQYCGGYTVWRGSWKFLRQYDLQNAISPGDIAETWEQQSFCVRCNIARTKTFRVIHALRRLGVSNA
jgi:hypothetical protein